MECERAPEKSDIIFLTVGAFDILPCMISLANLDYLIEGITAHHGKCSSQPRALDDHDQSSQDRIVCGNRQAILAQIASAFNAGGTKRILSRSFHGI